MCFVAALFRVTGDDLRPALMCFDSSPPNQSTRTSGALVLGGGARLKGPTLLGNGIGFCHNAPSLLTCNYLAPVKRPSVA